MLDIGIMAEHEIDKLGQPRFKPAAVAPTIFQNEPFGKRVDELSHCGHETYAVETEVQTGDFEDWRLAACSALDHGARMSCESSIAFPADESCTVCEPRRRFGVLLSMDANLIQTKFEKLGARAKVRPLVRNRWQAASVPVVIDIGHDRRGEFYDIQATDDADVEVLDVQPKDRHLLLMVRQPAERPGLPDTKDKFLCGHDERHWFVAGVPEAAPVSSVLTAKEVLKPEVVRNLESGRKGKQKKRHRRKTDTFIRQGEWFFIPAPGVTADEKLVLRSEPLRRGRGKPHTCEYLFRIGGTTVYVCGQYPNGLSEKERRALLKRNPAVAKWNWRAMQRDPTVFVRGKVSHADHATIHLDGWHRVTMNTENQSRALAAVAFLD